MSHNVINPKRAFRSGHGPGESLDPEAEKQLRNVAQMPFVFRWIAAMPDVHWGIGATVGASFPRRARSFLPQSASISDAA